MSGLQLVRQQAEQDKQINLRVKKTGDTMTGNLTMSGSAKVVGNVEGNATTATRLQTARNFSINGVSKGFNGTGNVAWTLNEIGVAPVNHNQASNTITTMAGYTKGTSSAAIATNDTLNQAIGKLEVKVDSKAPTNHTHNYAGSSSAGGAATTAVKLQTPRNINGVAFDGTKNITVADNTKLPLTGGTLTGDLTIARSNAGLTIRGKDNNYYKITHSSANGTLVFDYNTKGLFTIQNNGSIIPIGNKTMSIGDWNYRVSDVYMGNNTGDKYNGYSTMPNGYTLMWGSAVVPVNTNTTANVKITFPLVTKDQCFPVVSSFDVDGKLLTVNNLDATGFNVIARNLTNPSPNWNVRINWYCMVRL